MIMITKWGSYFNPDPNILFGIILMVKMPDNFNFCNSAPAIIVSGCLCVQMRHDDNRKRVSFLFQRLEVFGIIC